MQWFSLERKESKEKPRSREGLKADLQTAVTHGLGATVLHTLHTLLEKHAGKKQEPTSHLRFALGDMTLAREEAKIRKPGSHLERQKQMDAIAERLRDFIQTSRIMNKKISRREALSFIGELLSDFPNDIPDDESVGGQEPAHFEKARMNLYRAVRKGEDLMLLSLLMRTLQEHPEETADFRSLLRDVARDIEIRYEGLPAEDINSEEEWIEDLLAEDETRLPYFAERFREFADDESLTHESAIGSLKDLFEAYKKFAPPGAEMLDEGQYDMEGIAKFLRRDKDGQP